MVEAIGALERRIPVLTCFMSARGLPAALRAPGVRVPSFAFPEQAAIALAHAVGATAAWRARPAGAIAGLAGSAARRGAPPCSPRALDARRRAGSSPTRCGAARLLRPARWRARRVVATPDDGAPSRRRSMHGPVALKAVGPLHKTRGGRGRARPVPAADAVRRGRGEMTERL